MDPIGQDRQGYTLASELNISPHGHAASQEPACIGDFAGSRWWRFDFHAHTPASHDYGKGPSQKEFRHRTPRDWLLDFMRAKIDCVAVTDHNSADWVDQVKQAFAELSKERPPGFRKLYVFPGVEITVHGGFHLLAIFDPKESGQHILSLLANLNVHASGNEQTAICTEQSFPQVARRITNAGGLPIPAHVDRTNGVLEGASGATLAQILDCEAIKAAEVSDCKSLDSSRMPWVPVLGSDSHHPFGKEGQRFPGSHFTWVKMGMPSIEGLRLALTDGTPLSILRSDNCQSDPNKHSDLVIRQVAVSKAKYAGRARPLVVQFSPWLSTFIGGRGTGKSTVIEMMRLALRRDHELPGDLRKDLKRFARVPRSRDGAGALTEDSEIAVDVCKDGETFRIRWHRDASGPAIERRLSSGSWQSSPGDIRQRFPVRILSQRQILELATDPNSLIRLIDEAPTVNRSGWSLKQKEIETRFLRLRSVRRELKSRLSDRDRIKGEIEDLSRRIKILQESDHENVLGRFRKLQRQLAVNRGRRDEIDESVQRIREAAEFVSPSDFREEEFDESDPVESVVLDWHRNAVAEQRSSASALHLVATRLEEFQRTWTEDLGSSDFASRRASVEAGYTDLQKRLGMAGIGGFEQFGSLLRRRFVLQKKISELDRVKEQLDQVNQELRRAMESLEQLRLDLSERRKNFLAAVLSTNDYVRISLIPLGSDPRAQEKEFRRALCRIEGLDRDILTGDAKAGILAELYKDLPETCFDQRSQQVAARVYEIKQDIFSLRIPGVETNRTKWFRNHVENLTAEQLDHLLLWWPSDDLRIEYRRPESSRWAPIKSGSPGQKSAALLAFLLSYGDEPLILDQPEDDLDNQLIYDLIVKQIRESKRRRQIIVATHNANVVVNGDAEQVVLMAFRNGQCIVTDNGTGCIQESRVREGICRVLEGGSQAFEQRYKRLGRE